MVFFTMTALSGCIEELDIDTLGETEEEGLLVVESVLTNEVKIQQVMLSRSETRLNLETDEEYNPNVPTGGGVQESVQMESGATVRLFGSNGTTFDFVEGQAGTYRSTVPFALETDVDYELEITTLSGREYTSDILRIQGTAEITNVYAEKAVSDSGAEGVAIYVDSEPVSGTAQYYKYTYEETYKIVPPYLSNFEFRLTNYDPCALPFPTYDLQVVPKAEPFEACYNTEISNTILQESTVGNPNGNIIKKMVRFIGKDNYIMSYRYSILVKQQVQSAEAYNYFEALKNFSESGDLFSQIQPGALYANVRRKDGASENVLGYIDVVGVTEKRFFFNYEDFYPGEELPPYPFECSLQTAPESHISYCDPMPGSNPCPLSIIERVDQGLISYYDAYSEGVLPTASCPGPYIFVSSACGDCALGSKTKPEFWVD